MSLSEIEIEIMKVYIWYPCRKTRQVGHTSRTLEDETHISWWPSEETQGKKSKKTPQNIGSLDEDIELEGREPDQILLVTGPDEKVM